MAKTKVKSVFICQSCGAQRPRWEGKCSDCGSWNSFVEELTASNSTENRGWALGSDKSQPVALDQSLVESKMERWSTGYSELDRVLGGGLPRGSFVLLGGAPGIGKSTLLLQMSGGIAKHHKKVFYISGEESVAQTGSRAQRLGVNNPSILLLSESNLHQIIEHAKKMRPDVMVIDSIQTVYLPEIPAAPGSVSQVRECAGHLMVLAKQEGITVILVGHVTKDGNIAGPKVLEHMVDCVLSFEGDNSFQYRLLRSLKNRFGAALELGVFQMSGEGLSEVLNPSELFLQDRNQKQIGSAIFASIEGTRPLLCEIQALTIDTPLAMPRRTSVGVDLNRLHLLSAVIDRHLDIGLVKQDIYINVVGGLKVSEPAADLAVVAAILSNEGRKELSGKSLFFGEIGLTGEVRPVSFADIRIKEGDKLGFDHFVLPLANKKHLAELKIPSTSKISYIKSLRDLNSIL